MPFVNANNIKIYYRIFLDGIEVETFHPQLKTMIVLHGAPGILDHQAELMAWKGFSKNMQVVFLDLRGSGKCSMSWAHSGRGR